MVIGKTMLPVLNLKFEEWLQDPARKSLEHEQTLNPEP